MYLNGHSYYSYKYGVLSLEELLDLAVENGHAQLALTDINSTSGWVDFIRFAAKRDISPALGIDFRNGAHNNKGNNKINGKGYGSSLYVGLAMNEEGRHELNRFLSEHLMEKKIFPERAPVFENVVIIYPFDKISSWRKTSSDSSLTRRVTSSTGGGHDLTDLRSNEYIGIDPLELNRFRFSKLGKELLNPSRTPAPLSPEGVSTREPELSTRFVILHPASFRHKRDFNVHRLLRAMDNNALLSMLPKSEQGKESDCIIPRQELEEIFAEFPRILENTQRILKQCAVDSSAGFAPLKDGQHLNLQCYSGSKEEDERLIRALCEAGLPYRYPMAGAEVHARVEKELDIIIQKGFVSYFLINWDIVNYARKQGYFYVGRGSGANSVVAYLLRITDVDPIELDLYFERFINLFRSTPPDFDMDFSWADREDITRYIFERFPTACLLGAYSTFQFRAARRELGKVFGLPAEEIEQIGSTSQGHHFRPKWEKRSSTHAVPGSNDHLKQLVLRYTSYIQDMPSHLSIHSCGILIPDKPITYYTSTFMPPKGFPTAQISMLEAEDIGINKFDILSQRGLGKIKDSLTLIAENHPDDPAIDIHDIRRFKQDPEVKKLLRNGDAIGCFYVESPAMRMLMRKLEVDDYLGLVAASSVIRPGVAQSGMMQQYILRKRDPERRKDAHPVMLELMPETYGVMVYQEDVIKVAHYFAGLSLGEADVLRRGMSGKYRSREEFQAVKEKFFSNCTEIKGYTLELTAEIWRQTESFAGYAFAKGHSASYAVESYQSLFLKAYYPLEYMVATINNGGGFYTREHYIHEARMHGGIIEAPCVQESLYLTRIRDKVVHLGLQLVKGLDKAVADQIVAEREMGPYENLTDLLDRAPMGMEQLSILIHIGALRNLEPTHVLDTQDSVRQPDLSSSQPINSAAGSSKKELLWQAYAILEKKQKRHDEQMRMFRPPTKEYRLPHLDHQLIEDAFDEMEYLGFPLCHPFDLLRDEIDDSIRLSDLHAHVGQTVTVYGYLVTAKNTKTIKGDRMSFGNFVDRDGAFLDTVHFPQVAARYPFRGKGVYAVTGQVTEEWNFQTIEVQRMEKLPYVDDLRYAEAKRDAGDKEGNKIRTELRRKKKEKNPLTSASSAHRSRGEAVRSW